MSGETTLIYFSTSISKRLFNKVLKQCCSNWKTSLLFCGNKRLLYIIFLQQNSAKKYIQNILFSISIHRSPLSSRLFNKIFEMNKIEHMNCHVLFKQVHTMLCISTLEKMRSQIWWMDGWVRGFTSLSTVFLSYRDDGRANMKGSCAMKCRLRSGKISPQARFEPAAWWSEIVTTRKSNRRPTTLYCYSVINTWFIW